MVAAVTRPSRPVPIAAIVAGAVFLACLLRVLAMASAAATTAERIEWLLNAAAVARRCPTAQNTS